MTIKQRIKAFITWLNLPIPKDVVNTGYAADAIQNSVDEFAVDIIEKAGSGCEPPLFKASQIPSAKDGSIPSATGSAPISECPNAEPVFCNDCMFYDDCAVSLIEGQQSAGNCTAFLENLLPNYEAMEADRTIHEMIIWTWTYNDARRKYKLMFAKKAELEKK